MPLSLSSLVDLARDTFGNPRAGMRRVLNLGLTRGISIELLVLTAVISAVLSEISLYLAPMPDEAEMVRSIAGGPVSVVMMQIGLLLVVALGVHRIGRAMGGTGDLTGAMLVVVWVQVMMIMLQLVQMVTLLLVPPLATLIGLASIGVFFWMITNFVTELHGFEQRAKVFGVVMVGFVALGLVLSVVLSVLGFVPAMGV